MGVGRDNKGRFAKGHKISVGNKGGRPRRSTEETYLAAMRKGVSKADWLQVIAKALEQAMHGDKDARRFLAGYLQGLPTQYIQADTQTDTAVWIVLDE